MTARRLSGVTLGRKFTGQKKKSPAELKKSTHCLAYGVLGHWAGDPESVPAPKGKVLSVRDHSGAQLAVSDPPDQFGTMFSVQVNYHVHEVTATCSGTLWCDHHEAALVELKLKVKKVARQDTFQFGKGKAATSLERHYFPVGLNHTSCLIFGAARLEAEIPFLASNTLLIDLGMILDLPNMQAHFRTINVSVPIHMDHGHICVNIMEFPGNPNQLPVWEQLARSVIGVHHHRR